MLGTNSAPMPIEHPENNWYLRKHDNGEIFGPLPFERIREWAHAAQVNPQDAVSPDKEVWTKAPMIPELEMEWLIVVGEDLLYGPTTAEALLEFAKIGEINPDTALINCRLAESTKLSATPFYQQAIADPSIGAADALLQQPKKGGIRANLQQRLRELEVALMEKRRQLNLAEDTIKKLEAKVLDLELGLREVGKKR